MAELQASPKGKKSKSKQYKYNSNVKPYFKEIEEMAAAGMDDRAIAEYLKVTPVSFCNWKKDHKDLADLLDKARHPIVLELRRLLYESATKHTQTVDIKEQYEKIEVPQDIYDILEASGYDVSGLNQFVLVKQTKTIKEREPSYRAQLMMLSQYDKYFSLDPRSDEFKREELELKKNKEWE